MNNIKPKIKVYPGTLERNPYCLPEEGSSQIYSCVIVVTVNYEDIKFKISSGFNYEIEILNVRRLNEFTFKDLTIAFKYVLKFIKKANLKRDTFNYLSLARNYQIQEFWNLLKDMDYEISYQEHKEKIESFKAIEDQASKVAIQNKLKEAN